MDIWLKDNLPKTHVQAAIDACCMQIKFSAAVSYSCIVSMFCFEETSSNHLIVTSWHAFHHGYHQIIYHNLYRKYMDNETSGPIVSNLDLRQYVFWINQEHMDLPYSAS